MNMKLQYLAPIILIASLLHSAEKPNFVIILADDHGYGDVSAYQATDVQTPNIDSIGRDGILFTAMRANCTVCSPSRAALLTGRYADRVGVPGVIRTNAEDSWGYFKPGIPTLADELKKAGYHCGIVGKWHLGLESPNRPNDRGFDHFHGFLGDMMDSYTTHLRHDRNYMRHNDKEVTPVGHATEIFTDWAVDYIRERTKTKQPFFLYLAYNAPHFPIEPPPDWLAKVRVRNPQLNEKRAMNVAFVEHLDHCIGQVLNVINDLGILNDTFVAFSADNGGSLPHAQSNSPWRGGKQDHYDGGLRVPFMIRWPDQINAGGVSDYQGLNFDLFATCLDLAGLTPSTEIDAVSLAPLLKGKTMPSGRDLYFVRREGGPGYCGKSYEALIRDNWKLMQNDPWSPLELYDLKSDPEEKINLAKKAPKVFRELSARLRGHVQRGGATPWQSQNAVR
ncbi:MAG: sulfatase-like hydrolase/transferase [Verrucomicrobiaceae bacterium]|nr:sulfatase-like hydrolase/transferase [Verrucomicrobiaceae bacterium]